jgi:hypothetical protein
VLARLLRRTPAHTVTARDVAIMVRLVAAIDPAEIGGRDAAEGVALVHRCRAIVAVAKADDDLRIVP